VANSAIVGILRALLIADTAEFETAMKRAAQSAKTWSKDLGAVGRQASQIGLALTKTLTLPIVGLATASAKAAIDFESSFAGVRKTVDATEQQFAELAQGFRDLAKEIPVNVNELNKIGEAAGQLGIQTENIVGFTKVMAELGVTTNLSSDQAATSLARLANITGMPQTEFDKLGSTIVALGNNFATTESEIVDFGLRIAGAGEIAGLTESQILAIGSAMSSVGVQAEAGGTAVQKALNAMTKAVATGNQDLAVFAQTAGMSAKEFAAAFREDAGAAFTDFVEGLGIQGDKAFTTLDRLKLGNERVIRAFLSLSNAGDLLRRNLDLASDAWRENTALTEEARKRFETTASQLTLLWNAVKDVGITLGNALLPAIQSAIAAAKTLTPVLDKLAQGFADLPGGVQLVILGFGGLVAAAGPVLFVAGQLITAASTLIGAFTKQGIAMRALNAIYGETTVAATTASAAMTRFWLALIGPAAAFAGVALIAKALKDAQFEAEGLGEKTKAALRELDKLERFGVVTGKAGRQLVTGQDIALPLERAAAAVGEVGASSAGAQKPVAGLNRELDGLGDTSDALTKRLEALGETLSGRALQQQVDETALAIQRLGGIQAVSAAQQRTLAASTLEWARAGAALPPVLLDNWLANMSLAESLGGVSRNIKDVLDQARDMPEVMKAWEKSWGKDSVIAKGLSGVLKIGIGTPEIGTDFTEKLKAQWAFMFEEMKPVAVRLHEGLLEATRGLPSVLMQALTGGGDIGKSIGGLFSGSLFGKLTGAFDEKSGLFAGGIGGLLQKTLGKTIGGVFGSLIPGLGTLLGAGLGGLLDKVFDRSKGRDLVKQFAEQMGGFDALREKLLVLGDEGERLWVKLTQGVGRNDPKAAQAAIDAITKALERQQQQLEKVKQTLAGEGIWDRMTREMAAASLATGEDLLGMADAIERQQQRLGAGLMGVTAVVAGTQEEFDRLSRIALSTFNTLVSSGMGSADAMRQIGPSIDALIAQLDTLGFTSSEALDILRRWAGLVSENQPLLDQIAGLNELLIATANLGGLTEDAFDDLEAQGRSAFAALLEAGFTEAEALRQMAPLLQTLIDLHKDRGLTIDEETQKLIDQAREQGLLAEEGMATNDILIEGLGKIIELLGGQLPESWRQMSQQARDAVGDIRDSVDDLGRSLTDLPGVPSTKFDMVFDPGMRMDLPELAGGGVVTRRMQAIVGEAGPEAIVPLERFESMLSQAMASQGGSSAPNITIQAFDALSVREWLVRTGGHELLRYFETNDGGGSPVSPLTRFKALAT
jgi:TP901 family phage tail tape measure protein